MLFLFNEMQISGAVFCNLAVRARPQSGKYLSLSSQTVQKNPTLTLVVCDKRE